MAKDETNNLLQTLTEQRLGDVPARIDERPEPSEPLEPRETRDTEVGRRPEDVVRETRPAPEKPADKDKPKAPTKFKIQVENHLGQHEQQELTLEEIVERGLLEKLIRTANQFPVIQQKYLEQLEQAAKGKDVAKPEQKEAVTPEQQWEEYKKGTLQVLEAYRPLAERVVEFLIKAGKIEPDASEAYQELVVSVVADSAWKNDRIGELETKLSHVINWIEAEARKRNVGTVQRMLDQAIDAVAAKPEKVYEGLKNPETRGKFVTWLRTEVDPKVGSLTPENMERYWIAFNASDLLNFTKEVADKANKEPPAPRKRAQSDGSPSRPGSPESPKEKSLLDRLSESRLGPEA